MRSPAGPRLLRAVLHDLLADYHVRFDDCQRGLCFEGLSERHAQCQPVVGRRRIGHIGQIDQRKAQLGSGFFEQRGVFGGAEVVVQTV